ncbi:MAG: phospholipid carrier-dependent glycosyltransferase [Methanobacteriota archaeon]|nr:MAG: phospholipid carrier-dependent glycosyltransferase [Euryarchaeota archaeon]
MKSERIEMTESYVDRIKHLKSILQPSKNGYAFALGLTLLLSLGLRLYGIKWGLPNEHHILSYHPDEAVFLWIASQMDIYNLDFNPHWFIYPTFYYYVVLVPLLLIAHLGVISFEPDLIFYGLHPEEVGKALLIGRSITAVFGTLTGYITYLIGKEAYDENTGILSALFLAIAPLHVIHSHFLTTDVPVTFWIMTSVLFCFKILDSGDMRWYIFAGATGGLAIATKYNAGLIVLPILTAHILNRWKTQGTLPNIFEKKILFAVILLISAFLLTNLYAILDFPEFKRDVIWTARSLNVGGEVTEWLDTGSGWAFHIKSSLYYGLGAPLLLLGIFGAAVSLYRKTPRTLLLLSFFFPYYVLVGSWKVRYARHILPLIPFLTVFAAYGLLSLWHKTRKTGLLLLLIALGYTGALTLSYIQTMASPDPRDQARIWIDDNIPENSTIGAPYSTQFFTPPIDTGRYNLIFTRSISELTEKDVEYYIIDDLDYRVYMRSRKARELYPSEAEFIDYLFNGTDYKVVKTFQNKQSFLFINLTDTYLPHNMKYANPKIVIFERTDRDEI